jgi:hypothetical protein
VRHQTIAVVLSALFLCGLTAWPTAAQAPADRKAPQNQPNEASPHALTFYSAGLEGILVDPKDKGLAAALRMLDDRVLELPAELEEPIPGPPIQFALDLLMSPMTLRAGIVENPDPQAGPPFYAQLDFMTGSQDKAQALAGRFSAMIAQLRAPSRPAPDSPGLKLIDVNGVSVYHGSSDQNREAFTVAINTVDPTPLDIDRGDLPQGVEPALAFSFDAKRVQPLLQMMLAQGGPQAETAIGQLEMMGLYGPDAVAASGAIGYSQDRGHMAIRYQRYRQVMEKSGGLSDQRIRAEDLRRIPADATYAQLTKYNLAGMGQALQKMAEQISARTGEEAPDVMAMVEQQTGVNPQRDIFAHLGHTMGAYMSDTTGGGGLLSTVAFVEVSNQEALGASLTRLSSMANELAKQHAKGYVRIAERTVGDRKLMVLTFPGLPIPLELCWAMADGFLYSAASPQALIAGMNQGRGGKQSLADNPRFKEMGGDKVNDAIQVAFIDTPRLINGGYGIVSLAMAALGNAVRSPELPQRDPGMIMPSYSELQANAKAAVTIVRLQGDDVVMTSQYDRSTLVNGCAVAGMFGGYTGIAAAALAAGVTLPAVGKARDQAQISRSMVNLKQISTAIYTYGAEFDDAMPQTTEVLVKNGYIPRDLFDSPFGPMHDGGGDYFFNLAAVKRLSESRFPDRHVLGYDRALYQAQGRTVVVFYDGHIQQMDSSEFQELIAEAPNAGVDFKVP